MSASHPPLAESRKGRFGARFAKPLLLAVILFSKVVAQGETAAEAWVRRYSFEGVSSDDRASKVVTDSSGNVIVAGYTDNKTTGPDMLIIKYSGAGVPLWTNRYNGPGNGDDRASAMAVDSAGNVFVTGYSASTGVYPYGYDYATIAYSAAGVPLWTNRYNGLGHGDYRANAMAVEFSGNCV